MPSDQIETTAGKNTQAENVKASLQSAKESLEIRHLRNTIQYLKEADLLPALREELVQVIIKEGIDLCITLVHNLPEAQGSNKDIYRVISGKVLQAALNDPKNSAEIAMSYFHKDVPSLELVRFIALLDEVNGNFYAAVTGYIYAGNEEEINHTTELCEKYTGSLVEDSKYGLTLGATKGVEARLEGKDYLRENVMELRRRIIEGAEQLAEKTKDFKPDAEKILADVKQKIDELLAVQ